MQYFIAQYKNTGKYGIYYWSVGQHVWLDVKYDTKEQAEQALQDRVRKDNEPVQEWVF